MSTFVFTNDQQLTMDEFLSFLGGENKYMVIQGAAGCGKSTLIKHMVNASKSFCEMRDLLLKDQGLGSYRVVLAATTNPAVAVLEDLTGMMAKTIHSILGLKVVNNFSTGFTHLKLNKSAETLYNSLVIIDEGSMINSELFTMIDGQTEGCKIIIIGDQYQLAPVNENATVMETMTNVPRATMNKIMRNSGVIMQTGAMFRNTVDTLSRIQKQVTSVHEYNMAAQAKGVFPVIPKGHQELIQVDGPAFQAHVDAAFTDPDFALHKAKVIAWTNKRVLQYNEHIRSIMGLPVELGMGEIVITNKPILGRGKHISVDSQVEITGKGIRYQHEEHPTIWGRDVEIDSRIQEFLPEDPLAVKTVLNRLASAKNWREYFNLKETWFDLRSPHASTVHKAQGSSYDKVYIDLDDIGRCGSPTDVARMLYVAISRARKQVVLCGKLPIRYNGTGAYQPTPGYAGNHGGGN